MNTDPSNVPGATSMSIATQAEPNLEPAAAPRLLTTDDLLALPDDDVHRELIRGELRESPTILKDYPHGRALSRFGALLINWLREQPTPRGDVFGGDARVRLHRNPDSTVGIDVAYIGPELAARTADNAEYVDGPPTLAIEILSPWNVVGEVAEKVHLYLESGVAIVWVVDTDFQTITIYRPDALPTLVNADQEITAEPHLPGFRVAVAQFFEN